MMMKSNLNIKKIVSDVLKEHISQKEMINEAPKLSLGMGAIRDLIKKFESSYGDDLARTFERLIKPKGPVKNILIKADKQVILKSAKGTEVPLSQIEDAVDLIASGKMNLDDAAKYLPRQLADGTEFRSVLVNSLNKSKVKTTPVPPVPPVAPLVSSKITKGFKDFCDGLVLGLYDYIMRNFRKYSGFLEQSYYNRLGEVSKLQKRFNELANIVTEKIGDGVDQKLVKKELSEMANILARVGQRKDESLKITWQKFKEGMPEKFSKEFKNYKSPEFQKMVNWFEKLEPSKSTTSPMSTYSKMEGAWNLISKKESIGNKLQRILFTGTHLDPRTLSEINASRILYGSMRSLGKGISEKLIMGFVVFPWYYAWLTTALDVLKKTTGYGPGREKNITKTKVDDLGNIIENTSDIFAGWWRNFFNVYPLVGDEYFKLISWSPILFLMDKRRVSEIKPENREEAIKKTLPKVKEEMVKIRQEVKDTLATNPKIYEQISKSPEWKKAWDELFGGSESTTTTPKTNTVTPTNTTPTNTTIPGQTSWKLSDTSKTKVAPKF